MTCHPAPSAEEPRCGVPAQCGVRTGWAVPELSCDYTVRSGRKSARAGPLVITVIGGSQDQTDDCVTDAIAKVRRL